MSLKRISNIPKADTQQLIESHWHSILDKDLPPVDTGIATESSEVISIDVLIYCSAQVSFGEYPLCAVGYYDYINKAWGFYPHGDNGNTPETATTIAMQLYPLYWHALPPLPKIDSESGQITP